MKLRDMKIITISTEIDVETTLGRLNREEYLSDNKHGFKASHKVHKNKKKYNRKRDKNGNY